MTVAWASASGPKAEMISPASGCRAFILSRALRMSRAAGASGWTEIIIFSIGSRRERAGGNTAAPRPALPVFLVSGFGKSPISFRVVGHKEYHTHVLGVQGHGLGEVLL